jgi:hypothetical protein
MTSTFGDAKWLDISTNFVMTILILEFNAINSNRKTLELCIEKERKRKKGETTEHHSLESKD